MNQLAPSPSTLEPLRTPAGRYAMLALDQRESLRAMYPRAANGDWAPDDALRSFKSLATTELTPFASGVLLDRPYAVESERPAGLAEGCGLIVAADVLHQTTGDAVTGSSFDEHVTVEYLHRVGAAAIKFLVIWRGGVGVDERARLVTRAIELAKAAGVASLIEGVVRTDDDSPWSSQELRHQAILAAAEELASFGPDVYKAEVPGYAPGDVSRVTEQSERMSEIVGGDWVVLSNGVERDDFAGAVEAAVRGGASGFLAGRAIWADIIGAADITAELQERSAPRLRRLGALVDSL